MRVSPSLALGLVGLVLFLACEDAVRDRDLPETDAAIQQPDAAIDGALADQGVPEDDAAPAADGDVAPQDASRDGQVPDGPPPPPEECNGEDEDGDGEIDEGVSNICGGCGGIPPEGCQAWVLQAVQNEAGRLNPNTVASFAGAALGFSERAIENGTCVFFRIPAQHPDAHLGLVNVESRRARLNLVPTYRPETGTHRYQNSPPLDPLQLHDTGDEVSVVAGGGLAVGPLEMSERAPAALSGVRTEDLGPVLDLARGEAGGEVDTVTLRWTPAEPEHAGELRFFVGGSIPVLNIARFRYEVRAHYQVTALLEDDGELEVPVSLFGGGVPDSSVRVFLERRRTKRISQGPHAIELRVGQRLTEFRNGILQNDEAPPFQITEPSPNVRRIVPGMPLVVAWTELPEGVGPLTVALRLSDGEALEQRTVECVVDDPAVGRVVLPADVTESWPVGPDDTRLLSVGWTVHRAALEGGDVGTLTRSLTALVWLDAEPLEEE